MKLIIEDDEGHKTVVPFAREEITIGRQEGNTIRLTERNISRRHARLVRLNGHVVIEDLGSYNGIRVNGEKIAGKAEIGDGDLIQIGDYDLAIQDLAQATAAPHPSASSRPTIPMGTAVPRPAHDEVATEIDAAVAGDDIEATSPQAQAFEDSEGTPAPSSNPSRRESTAIIRVDQLQSSKGGGSRQLRDLDGSEAPKLVILNTELAGREFACTRTELKLGRTEENDIQIEHRSLSRTHCKVVREDNGDWKILDLQSANGIAINGEQYAKATLNHGDVIELGHVKLRFVGPGQTYAFKAGDDAPLGKKRLPIPLIAGGAGGLVLLLVLLVAVFSGGDAAPPPAARPIPIAAQPAQPAQPAEQDTVVEVTEEVPAAAPAEAEPEAEQAQAQPPPVDSRAYARQLQAAQSAVDARQFEKALPLLEKLKADHTPVPAEVQELLDQSIDELAAKDAIGQAVRQLNAGKLDQASELLDRAQTTVAFADDLDKVRARVNNAIAAKEAREIAKATGGTTVRRVSATAAPKAPTPQELSRKAFEEGTALFKRKQFRDAIGSFNKCLEADPGFARCHMMLGSTHAKLKNIEEGARHYRMFVKLSPPDDAEALKVKKFLDEYEASKK